MLGTFATICAVTVVGTIIEDLLIDERSKEVVRLGTFGIDGALVIGLVIKTYKIVKAVINGD